MSKRVEKAVANRKHPVGTPASSGAEPDLAGAAERAGLAIRDLQSRLSVRTAGQTPEAGDAAAPGDELDKQLKEYFDRAGAVTANMPPSVLNALREKVVEGVVERILSEWKQPGSTDETPLLREVIDRLIARVMGRLGASDE